MHRTLAVLAIAVFVPSGLRAGAAARVGLDKVVASLVRDLGADLYDVRERASATLRQLGEPAAAALEQAAGSDDPEIRVRAREILADVQSGIRPHWPAETVLLMRHIDRRRQHERYQVVQQIAASIGHEATPFLVQRLAVGDSNEVNYALRALQNMKDDRAWKQVLQLIQKPANDAQARALAWARGKSGQAIEAIERLAREQIQKGERDQAVEAGIQDILGKLKAGKGKGAAAAADTLAKAAPDDARVLYLKAEALVLLDRDREAIAVRKRALELQPDSEAPHFLAGDLLGTLGRRRLAAREWERILTIQPNDGVYDINAWLSLSSIYADSGLFEQAAQYLEKAQQRYAKLKAAKDDAVARGTIESLQAEVNRLRQQASRFPTPGDPVIQDPLPASELQPTLAVAVKDGETKQLQKALASAAAQIRLAVEPPGLRLFEATSAALRYDKANKQLLVLLGDTPACKPFPFEAKGKTFEVAVHAGDQTHVFQIDAATGEAAPAAKFEKDYVLTIKPGVQVGALTSVTLRINGRSQKWSKAIDTGVTLDRLPDHLVIAIEGTTASNVRLSARVQLVTPEPRLEP